MSGLMGVVARIGLSLSGSGNSTEIDPMNDGNWLDKLIHENAQKYSTGVLDFCYADWEYWVLC